MNTTLIRKLMISRKYLDYYNKNDHNSAVIRVTELIPGVSYTSRPSRSSWDRSRSISADLGGLFDDNIGFVEVQFFVAMKTFSKQVASERTSCARPLTARAGAWPGRAHTRNIRGYFGDSFLIFSS